MRGLHRLSGLAMAILVLTTCAATVAANPKERLEYWRQNYQELLPTEDPHAARAHDIFHRLLHVAGQKPGVMPRLYITKLDPWNISVPIALPDGGIILSKGALEICYREPARGDDRLAFVLAHELAHQLKDDFWHMKFFQAIEASKARASQSDANLEEIFRIARLPDDVQTKELQADQHGIVYTSMAGFNTNAIVTEDNAVNFFQDWARALEPSRIGGVPTYRSHPSPQQRAEAIKMHLRQILDEMEAFNVGLWFYQAGNYQKAILAFEDFLHFFPSREVYHNLAVSHHQLALQYYQLWKKDTLALPFKLSLAVDPVARAGKIALRGLDGTGKPAELFHAHLEKAIEFYHTAISLDPSYALASSNLGCALIVKQDVYKAIAMLQDALKIAPNSPQILNNLGVAFFYAENPRQAKAHLTRASELAPTYDAPVFNLGQLAHDAHQEAEAQRYGLAYLQLDPASPWADRVRQRLAQALPPPPVASAVPQNPEAVMGVTVGTFADEVPASWGEPRKRQLTLEAQPFTVARYSHVVMTLSPHGEILMITVLDGYKGKSAKGVSLGISAQEVLAHYGRPAQILEMAQGESWVYEAQGIAFQFRDQHVTTWQLF
jgi:tetratricopeptide (TPR) repeat protein